LRNTFRSVLSERSLSNRIDQLVENVDILYHYITSDQKSLFLSLHNVGACENPTVSPVSVWQNASVAEFVTDWKRCDDAVLYQCSCTLDDNLRKIDLPLEPLDIQHSCQLPEAPQDICIQLINDYYSSVMSCIESAYMSTLPSKRVASYHEQYVIPGWN